jgi:prolyl oligopeptidase
MAIPFFISSARLALAFVIGGAAFTLQAAPLSQPVAPVCPVTDTYFGTPVVDPYRWMEDLKSPEVQSWMKAQNDYTRDYLSHLPGRDALIKRVLELDNASTRVGGLSLYGTRQRPDAQALRPRRSEGRGTSPGRSAGAGRFRQTLHDQ